MSDALLQDPSSIAKIKSNIFLTLWYVVIVIGILITLLPFVWAIANSFKENHEIFAQTSPISLQTFVPGNTLEAYRNIFVQGYGRVILNTIFVASMTVFFGILINAMAGFAFAVFKFRGRTVLFAFVLLTFTVPAEAIAIPTFILIRQLGWFDSFTALIVPGLANGVIIFLYRQFFSAIPYELYEAAKVDGVSWHQVFFRIAMPVAKPVTIGAGLLLFVSQWESFLWPLIAAPSPHLHLIQVAVSRFSTEYSVVWNQQFAASSIAGLLPLIFIYKFQRQFVSALTGVDLK